MSLAAKTLVDPHLGTTVADARTQVEQVDRYLLLRKLGQGGMGYVFEAYDPDLERRVAIEVMNLSAVAGGSSNDASFIQACRHRFVREARSLAKLAHPNIVPIFDVGLVASGDLFLAMELVGGEALSHEISRGPIPWQRAVAIANAVAQGLAYAHQSGIIHRDIKPDNLMLGRDGVVRILDFGIAGLVEPPAQGKRSLDSKHVGPLVRVDQLALQASTSADVDAGQTVAGSILGTPRYMAPEQARGNECSPASDIFSLCLVLFELLEGRPPFPGTTPELRARQIAAGMITWHGSHPKWLRQLVEKGLSTEPSQRIASMTALQEALERGTKTRKPSRMGWSLIAGTAAASMFFAFEHLIAVSTPTYRCEQPGEQRVSAWREEKMRSLQDSFLAPSIPAARDIWPKVEASLNGWIERWQEVDAMRCNVVDGKLAQLNGSTPVNAADTETIARCLTQRAASFNGFLSAYAPSPSLHDILETRKRLADIPEPRGCLDPDAYRIEAPLPNDPVKRTGVQSVRDTLASLAANWAQDGQKDLSRRLEEIRETVRSLDFAPLQAEYEVAWSNYFRHARNDSERQAQALERALAFAIAGNHELVASNSSVGLAMTRGYYLNQVDREDELLRQADALITAANNPPQARYHLTRTQAIRLTTEGKMTEALDLFGAAQRLAEAGARERPGAWAQSLGDLGITALNADRLEMAEYYFERALRIRESLYGISHPEVFRSNGLLAYVSSRRGRLIEAQEYARGYLVGCTRSGLPDPACGIAHGALLDVLIPRGSYEDAIAHGVAWFAAQAELGKREQPPTLWAISILSEPLRLRGEVAAALQASQEGVERIERETSVRPAVVAGTWLHLAEAQIAAEMTTAAEESLKTVSKALMMGDPAGSVWKLRAKRAAGDLALTEKKYSEALGYFEEAEVQRLLSGGSDVEQSENERGIAQALLGLGELDAALDYATSALQHIEQNPGLAPHLYLPYRILLAQIYISLDRVVPAMNQVDTARAQFDATQVLASQLAPLLFLEAQIYAKLDNSPSTQTRARELAFEAINAYSQWDRGADAALDTIHTWLDASSARFSRIAKRADRH